MGSGHLSVLCAEVKFLESLGNCRIFPLVLHYVLNGIEVDVDRLCGLVVRVLGYRSGGPGSIPGTTRKKSRSGTGSTKPREYNSGAALKEKYSGSGLENREYGSRDPSR
jgi:hypothetical protein